MFIETGDPDAVLSDDGEFVRWKSETRHLRWREQSDWASAG